MKADAQRIIVTAVASSGRVVERLRVAVVMPPISARRRLSTSNHFYRTVKFCCTVAVMLDLHRLRVFRAVVASGSVNAAAANLGYTPSAVSQHVTALQRGTGLALLARAGRGVEPTTVGHALARRVDGLLAQLGDVEAFVADLRDGRTGSLSVAYFSSVGSAWMPAVARTLLQEFPDLRLDLELRDDLETGGGRRPDVQIVVAPPGFRGTREARAHHLLD